MAALIFFSLLILAGLAVLHALKPSHTPQQHIIYVVVPTEESRAGTGELLLGLLIFGGLVLLLLTAVPS